MAAVKADGRSMSAISIAAGQKNRGYLRSILYAGKNKPVQTPGTTKLTAICKVLWISIDEITGLDPDIKELWENLSAGGKEALKTVGYQLLKAEGKE